MYAFRHHAISRSKHYLPLAMGVARGGGNVIDDEYGQGPASESREQGVCPMSVRSVFDISTGRLLPSPLDAQEARSGASTRYTHYRSCLGYRDRLSLARTLLLILLPFFLQMLFESRHSLQGITTDHTSK